MMQLVIAFAGGVFAAISFFSKISPVPVLIIIITLSGFMIVLQLNKKFDFNTARLWGICACFVFFFLGLLVTLLKYCKPDFTYYYQQGAEVHACILDITNHKPGVYKASAEIFEINHKGRKIKTQGNVFFYFREEPVIHSLFPGQCIRTSAVIKPLYFDNNPHQFNYPQYCFYKSIRGSAWLNSGAWHFTRHTRHWLVSTALRLRQKMMRWLARSGMHGHAYAVTGAMLLGSREEISDEINREFAVSGAMHILSVSGLHTGVVCLLLQFIFGFLRKTTFGRWFYAFLLLMLLWFYALVTGLSAAVVRATTMFSVVVIGDSLKRPVNPFNSIATSLLIILFLNPFLLMDIGLQFSYLAVTGIILIYPWLSGLVNTGKKWLTWLWSMISVSLAAQAGITPLLIMKMHSFSTWFLITNIFVVPLSALIIYAGLATLTLSFLPPIAKLTGFVTQHLTEILLQSVKIISHLPGAAISPLTLSPVQAFITYYILSAMVYFLITKNKKGLFHTLAAIILFTVISVWMEWQQLHQQRFTIYNCRNTSCYSFICGHTAVIFADTGNPSVMRCLNEDLIHSGINQIWPAAGLKNHEIRTPRTVLRCLSHGLSICSQNKKIYIPGALPADSCLKQSDILVITETSGALPVNILDQYIPEIVILDSGCNRRLRNHWIRACKRRGVPVYNTTEQGSYSLTL